jgi:hypothetical protein
MRKSASWLIGLMRLAKALFVTNSPKAHRQMDEAAERVEDAPDDELDEILDEGMRSALQITAR